MVSRTRGQLGRKKNSHHALTGKPTNHPNPQGLGSTVATRRVIRRPAGAPSAREAQRGPKNIQSVCKPGSVWRVAPPRRPFICDVCCQTPVATNPGDGSKTSSVPGCPARGHPYLVLLPVGFALPRLLPAARCALTAPFHPYPSRRTGGLFSVALSLGLPPAAVSRHRVFVEPGLSSRPCERATVRPTGSATWG